SIDHNENIISDLRFQHQTPQVSSFLRRFSAGNFLSNFNSELALDDEHEGELVRDQERRLGSPITFDKHVAITPDDRDVDEFDETFYAVPEPRHGVVHDFSLPPSRALSYRSPLLVEETTEEAPAVMMQAEGFSLQNSRAVSPVQPSESAISVQRT